VVGMGAKSVDLVKQTLSAERLNESFWVVDEMSKLAPGPEEPKLLNCVPEGGVAQYVPELKMTEELFGRALAKSCLRS